MKKIVLIALTLLSTVSLSFAQNSNWSEEAKTQIQGKGQRLNAEDRAKKQTQEMTKALELSESQQKDVEAVLIDFHGDMDALRASKSKTYEEMDNEERAELKDQHLKAQNELNKQMKKILNEEQYDLYKEKMGEWQRKMRKRRAQRRK